MPVVSPVFKEDCPTKNIEKYVLINKICLICNMYYSKQVNVFNIYKALPSQNKKINRKMEKYKNNLFIKEHT